MDSLKKNSAHSVQQWLRALLYRLLVEVPGAARGKKTLIFEKKITKKINFFSLC